MSTIVSKDFVSKAKAKD